MVREEPAGPVRATHDDARAFPIRRAPRPVDGLWTRVGARRTRDLRRSALPHDRVRTGVRTAVRPSTGRPHRGGRLPTGAVDNPRATVNEAA
jgi:hypothetical protein